jgi:hypothetical protein
MTLAPEYLRALCHVNVPSLALWNILMLEVRSGGVCGLLIPMDKLELLRVHPTAVVQA